MEEGCSGDDCVFADSSPVAAVESTPSAHSLALLSIGGELCDDPMTLLLLLFVICNCPGSGADVLAVVVLDCLLASPAAVVCLSTSVLCVSQWTTCTVV